MTERSVRRPQWQEIFQGYDIRGRYPWPVGPATGRQLGDALARALHGPFLVGRDTRRESAALEPALVQGLRARRALVVRLGITPTPEVAYLARTKRCLGLVVTPSHNALGFVGVKGFSTTGRLFDREWQRVAEAYGRGLRSGRGPKARRREVPRPRLTVPVDPARAQYRGEYLDHLTRGLESRLTVAVDTRGGATAWLAPRALERIGARQVSLTDGFSPTFFGRTPEPVPESLGALRQGVRSGAADLGFAFDGDGDRCVTLDEGGRLVDPETIALLLQPIVSEADRPIVASADCSRILEQNARTIRCRVGGRFMVRAMRRVGAEIGIERSGHFYLRRYGADSDAMLTACLVAHAVYHHGQPMSRLARTYGRIFRSARTLDYSGPSEARRAYRALLREVGDRGTPGFDGVAIEFAHGWCLVRRSNTQPSIRLSIEASGPAELRRIERLVLRWTPGGQPRQAAR